ncbi:NAD(P)-dependent dehydrogenase (short-subunit alcohol dehydrogenase family) [Flavobacterium sp. HSC-32F16]|uniref:SDR family oxidoreductase n=1 Tax=Flavobacterium sp. HSC-32F16 TaxID=2910964 RepID=UPI0020A39FF6|nr:SDR family oxidoreductase [Flavobacterium sp. HSC-32F16]MCP2028506.1 NAD(P)-dependent dehydrogenase (short-subunit alcohol dehydrogenase family) [Flavobacterium sp. HSC-32F16]
MNTNKVWLVTGASKGLGLSLVKKLLHKGYRVAATSRNITSLQLQIGEASDTFLPLAVDLISDNSVKNAIEKSIAHFGQIDVVVNNAGFGQIGTLEELTDEEARYSFDVNVFGLLNVVRNVTPYLRKQQSGHIFNIASIVGFYGSYPGWGIYSATKFAVAGLTEGLAEEVKEFGIKATVVYPGYFRTEFFSKDSLALAKNPIHEYKAARQSEQYHVNHIEGTQPNDPEKAADVLINASQEITAPLHLFLGLDAHAVAVDKVKIISNELENWKEYSTATSF